MLYSAATAQCGRRGGIVPLIAISLVALLAVTGLVIDGGLLMRERREAQNAADAGALAAAVDLLNLRPLDQAARSAYEYAGLNDYTTDSSKYNLVANSTSITSSSTSGNTTVTVNIPPLSGSRAGNRDFAEVITTRTLNTFFIRVMGSYTSQTSARAVAGVLRPPASPYGMVALNKTGPGVQINGTGGFTINAPVITFSTDYNSLQLGGSPSAKSAGPLAGWYTNGGYVSVPIKSWTDGTTIPAGGSFSPTPSRIPSTVPILDPLINMPVPPRTNLPTFGPVILSAGQSVTIDPGIYTGGIKVTGNSKLTLNPGLYIIDGGGVRIGSFDPVTGNPLASDSSAMIANKVTFYNTGTASTFGPFLLSYYGTRTTLSPPDQLPPNTALDPTKGLPGLTLFQDRNNPKDVWLVNQAVPMSGTYYAASGSIRFNGQGINPANPVQIIAGRIIVDTDTPSGNAESDVPYNAKIFAPPPEIYLVE